MNKRICGVLLMIAVGACGMFMPSSAMAATISGIYISEIRISGQDEPKEFVELYNPNNGVIDLSSYYIEYAKPTFLSDHCAAFDWKLAALENDLNRAVNRVRLTDIFIQPRGRIFVVTSMNNDIAGSVRLTSSIQEEVVVHDLVGWGSAESLPACSKGLPAPIPLNGTSLKRLFNADGFPVVLENNIDEYEVSDKPTPTQDLCIDDDLCIDAPPVQDEIPTIVQPIEYLPLWISELLPDPSLLPDNEAEFIELYNPNQTAVTLEGYALQTGSSNSKKYVLPNYILNSHEYLAIYSSESGLNLSNNGGQARLYSPADTVIYETPIYEAVKKDIAWSLIGSQWEFTNQPTPKNKNKPSKKDITTAVSSATSNGLKPCPEGWYRNPSTNRCKKIVTSAATTYTPCPEGYERNPATNRCKKIAVDSGLKPCEPGYERNPETNRCRKVVQPVAAVAGIETSSDTKNTKSGPALKLNWLIGVSLTTLVIGYGVYEWRHEILSGISHLRDKLSTNK